MATVKIDEPRWDQSTYEGRANHFFTTTNPLNLLCSDADLNRAKEVVDKYRYFKLSKKLILKDHLQYISSITGKMDNSVGSALMNCGKPSMFMILLSILILERKCWSLAGWAPKFHATCSSQVAWWHFTEPLQQLCFGNGSINLSMLLLTTPIDLEIHPSLTSRKTNLWLC